MFIISGFEYQQHYVNGSGVHRTMPTTSTLRTNDGNVVGSLHTHIFHIECRLVGVYRPNISTPAHPMFSRKL